MKAFMIFMVSAVLGISFLGDTPNTTLASTSNENNTATQKNSNEKVDFILGNWVGTGFVTDENGMQQYIEVKEDNVRIANDEYQMTAVGQNPANSYRYLFNKTLFFNNKLNSWFMKGGINNRVLHDSRTLFGENNTMTYSYYDPNSILVRYTIARESDDSFTETEEKWGANGWDKTAWFRMKRDFNNTSRPIH